MYHQLTREQRYAIYLGLQEGKSREAIVRQIKVHPSTVGREIKRNPTRLGRYSWRVAQETADLRKERLPGNRGVDRNVLEEALRLLKTEDWSPRQISGYLSLKSRHISHETIYKRIRSDESGELRGHCRHPRQTRGSRREAFRELGDGPDHREGTEKCHAYLVRALKKLPSYGKASTRQESGKGGRHGNKAAVLTTDNGSEFACHKKIAKALGTTVYFADSYASWQKGAIENGNKLIRQYIPKGTDLRELSEDFIKEVQYKINRRPREKLNFSTPKNEFFKLIS